ncbi:MAG: hypothetical protein EOO13_15110 [Chitinophagaceae bacterium]|nr:MAG: hypothetical protein EOO13_15110 [Chitinophagaceae bacterium]
MLTEKQKAFLDYWEKEREAQSSFSSKVLRGLPMAVMFGMPIILFILVVYLWFPDWYMKISGTSAGSFIMVVIGVLISIIFFSYFRMHFKWEMNEQLYTELKIKQQKEQAANL